VAPSAGHRTSTLSGLSWATPPDKGFVTATEDQSLGGNSCIGLRADPVIGAPGSECNPEDEERRGEDGSRVDVPGVDTAGAGATPSSSICKGKREMSGGKLLNGGEEGKGISFGLNMAGIDAASSGFEDKWWKSWARLVGDDLSRLNITGVHAASSESEGERGKSGAGSV
jgi:hypothetical protein